jgi:DNA mismatch endonuclease (patch repair protein)
MQGNSSRDTSPELAVRRLLHAAGYRYRVCTRPVPQVRRTADILFTAAKVAVFIDGCFWHQCPQHYKEPKSNIDYWRPKLDQNAVRDIETTAVLEQAGWVVLRFWSHENPVFVADQIAQSVSEARGSAGRGR